ncbi:Hypothetical_protein [Hexamita inflata]|uniref:Hypothetical_protein n=1 Tax=Hexamita inflata TaxID=28002 RepID=A0AA86QTZ8_9EUKA|nr:Hypothetical protein HINF_LOCUS46929 [Hexamita inflata]
MPVRQCQLQPVTSRILPQSHSQQKYVNSMRNCEQMDSHIDSQSHLIPQNADTNENVTLFPSKNPVSPQKPLKSTNSPSRIVPCEENDHNILQNADSHLNQPPLQPNRPQTPPNQQTIIPQEPNQQTDQIYKPEPFYTTKPNVCTASRSELIQQSDSLQVLSVLHVNYYFITKVPVKSSVQFRKYQFGLEFSCSELNYSFVVKEIRRVNNQVRKEIIEGKYQNVKVKGLKVVGSGEMKAFLFVEEDAFKSIASYWRDLGHVVKGVWAAYE